MWRVESPPTFCKSSGSRAFMERFKSKGRFAELLGRIPMHVVVTPAGLAGAAACGLENPGLS